MLVLHGVEVEVVVVVEKKLSADGSQSVTRAQTTKRLWDVSSGRYWQSTMSENGYCLLLFLSMGSGL